MIGSACETAEKVIADVKKLIESTQGQNVYPADQQMFIHQGKVLKADTALEENKVLENNILVIMLSKSRGSLIAAPATFKALPTSLLAFQDLIYPLKDSWVQSGLGHDYGIKRTDIEKAATLHYSSVEELNSQFSRLNEEPLTCAASDSTCHNESIPDRSSEALPAVNEYNSELPIEDGSTESSPQASCRFNVAQANFNTEENANSDDEIGMYSNTEENAMDHRMLFDVANEALQILLGSVKIGSSLYQWVAESTGMLQGRKL